MEEELFFTATTNVLVSSDFRETLIRQDTTLIEQRLISCILSSLKDIQSKLIKVKTPINDLQETQNLKIDFYKKKIEKQGTYNFCFSLREINPMRKMRNQSIKHALVNMSNINWLQVKDDSIKGWKAIPFIVEPRWNCSNIYFKMNKDVLKHLVNMSQYCSLLRELPYEVSSSNTIKFLLWLQNFKKSGSVTRNYQQLLRELYIPKDKYIAPSHFERDFLINVKADLEAFNDHYFEFICKDRNYTFFIKRNPISKTEKEKLLILDDIRIKRSVKYLKKTRSLSPTNIRMLLTLFDVKSYKSLAKHLKCKIDPILKGDEYIKAVFLHLEKNT